MIDWEKLIEERDAWVAHNFPVPTVPDPGESLMGMIEELGELTHAVLKAGQDIRGPAVKHHENMIDAVGDFTIYMLGVMSWAGMKTVEYSHMYSVDVRALLRVLAKLDQAVASSSDPAIPFGYLNDIRWYTSALASMLSKFCKDRGWEYDAVVIDTWEAVKQRDWIKFPTDGKTK